MRVSFSFLFTYPYLICVSIQLTGARSCAPAPWKQNAVHLSYTALKRETQDAHHMLTCQAMIKDVQFLCGELCFVYVCRHICRSGSVLSASRLPHFVSVPIISYPRIIRNTDFITPQYQKGSVRLSRGTLFSRCKTRAIITTGERGRKGSGSIFLFFSLIKIKKSPRLKPLTLPALPDGCASYDGGKARALTPTTIIN